MKKSRKTKKNDSATTARRLPALVALAVVVLVIGAISAVSRQLIAGKQSQESEKPVALGHPSDKKFTTVKVAGQDVQVDGQTGKLKPLTPEQAQRLAEGLKKMVNKSADGLALDQHEDGSVSMDLQGRFRHVVVARATEDGSVSMSCVDNPQAAAAAIGVDPKLLGVEGAPGAKPTTTKPQRN